MMVSTLAIALLSAASLAAADAETARVSYSNCLTDFTVEHLDQKTARGPFRKAAENACSTEREAMIAMIKKDELEFGSTEDEAMTYAVEEADGVLSSFTGSYAGYMSSNTRPMKEE